MDKGEGNRGLFLMDLCLKGLCLLLIGMFAVRATTNCESEGIVEKVMGGGEAGEVVVGGRISKGVGKAIARIIEVSDMIS